jgi:undecaprenyl-diphosphatase
MATTSIRPTGTAIREPSRRDLSRLRGDVVVTTAAVVFTVLAVAVRSGWTPLLDLDAAVAHDLNAVVAPRPALIRTLTAVTTLGSAGVLVWLIVLALILLLIRRRFSLAAFLAASGSGALILDPTLKALIGRLRPVVEHPVAVGGGNSFPSGHSLDSFICYGALLLVFLPAFPRRRRWIPVAAASAIIVLIGLTRILLGVHFVSDVLGAWSAGTAWLGLTVFAFELHRARTGRRVPQPLTEGLEPEAAADVEPAETTRPGATGRAQAVRTTARLVVGWVFVLGVVVGLGELVLRAGHNLLGDESIPRGLASHRTPALDAISDFWSQAGNTHAILAVGLVAGAVAVGVIRHWRPAVFLVVLMMGELTLFLVSAKVVGRDRPDVPHLDGPLPTSAYPSGHVAATLCLYAGIALLVLPRTRAWWRWLTLVPVVAMPILVAASRMYRGMHHPTDIVASLVLAGAWTTVAYLSIRPDMDGPSPARPVFEPGPEREPVDTHIDGSEDGPGRWSLPAPGPRWSGRDGGRLARP